MYVYVCTPVFMYTHVYTRTIYRHTNPPKSCFRSPVLPPAPFPKRGTKHGMEFCKGGVLRGQETPLRTTIRSAQTRGFLVRLEVAETRCFRERCHINAIQRSIWQKKIVMTVTDLKSKSLCQPLKK